MKSYMKKWFKGAARFVYDFLCRSRCTFEENCEIILDSENVFVLAKAKYRF